MRLAALCVLAMAALAAPAGAYWSTDGKGSGAGSVVTMPAGQQPSTSADGQNVSVTWTQSTLLGPAIGSYIGGGYTVARYAAGGSTPTTPNASCTSMITGAGTTLTCVEAGTPYGSWRYAITPVLGSFSGEEGPKSAPVDVVTDAPVLATVVRADPVGTNALGDLQLSWAGVTGATGYNVYRRTSSGTYAPTPLNPAPLATTAFTDPGSGLAAGTSYIYVVRAVAGSPAVQSAASNERSVTPTGRPAAPETVSATAAVGARVDVSWASVPGATGYSLYRRTATGSFDYAARLGGAAIAGTTFADMTAIDGQSYVYVVRTVVAGVGPIESFSSVESATVKADGTAPAAPTAVSVTNGPVLAVARCGIAAGTRFVNGATRAAVSVSAALAAPEPGATVHFSATTPTSGSVTGSGPAAPGTATLNLTALADGVLTLTAYSRDAAGNVSPPTAMTATVRKDVVFTPALTIRFSPGILGLGAKISGNAECGASIVATKNSQHVTDIAGSSNTWEIGVGGLLASSGWTATATDLAGNTAGPVSD